MVRDGYKFVLPLMILTGLSVFLHQPVITAIFLVLTAFTAFFFRNPVRQIPDGENLIVSPADGKVVKISKDENGEQTLCIFLNVFNVHVNRAPIAGSVARFEYRRGKFKVAFDEEASRVNEQNIVAFAGPELSLVVKQVAGLIARRVVCWKKPGDAVGRGELFGLIRFGSRVDVVMPAHVNIRVAVGDKVRGGSSIIGDYK
ncbi:MAG: phosphatidylserine decarboxylase family protein [Acidobacteriota bacterium]|jgi:phosphatidylserine decarboxylase|nr:phosphatidylserine decarboxylase family protein [Acidobacteriota bacterium]